MIIIDKDTSTLLSSPASGVMRLPAEVLEEVLSYVDDHDVINAANSSIQFNNVCQRIARKRCALKIPQVGPFYPYDYCLSIKHDNMQDILTEILSEQEWGVVDWVEVWKCWVSSSLDTCHSAWSEDMGSGHVTRSIQLSSQVRNMTAYLYYYYSGLGHKHCH